MLGRRIIYALTWIGCVVFFVAYQEWFSWFLLVTVTVLPVFSLLISLPAMLTARLEFAMPSAVTANSELVLDVRCKSWLPAYLRKCSVSVSHSLTGRSWKFHSGGVLPTAHCGALNCTVTRAIVCDYLGLFRRRLRCPQPKTVLIRPTPVPMKTMPQMEQQIAASWRPKRGGGFAENHELRLYRPGDNVQQIHWKLSSKTGKLILREPMELQKKTIGLVLALQGSPEELDRKLGRLLWLGNQLLQKNTSFEIHCLSASGSECWSISCERDLQTAMDSILTRRSVYGVFNYDPPAATQWQHWIGGDADEA